MFSKFFVTILSAFLLFVFCLNIFTLFSVEGIKRAKSINSGYFLAIVGSGSMEPELSVGDLLIIKSEDFYTKGDVVTFVTPRGAMVTHEIIEVTRSGYITRGRANNISDGEILPQRVLGKILFVFPGVGLVADLLLSPAGIVLMLSIFGIILVLRRLKGGKNDEKTPFFDEISSNS